MRNGLRPRYERGHSNSKFAGLSPFKGIFSGETKLFVLLVVYFGRYLLGGYRLNSDLGLDMTRRNKSLLLVRRVCGCRLFRTTKDKG
jgi:hypothetical protein